MYKLNDVKFIEIENIWEIDNKKKNMQELSFLLSISDCM